MHIINCSNRTNHTNDFSAQSVRSESDECMSDVLVLVADA